MNERFAPEWPRVKRILDNLTQAIAGAEHLLVEAFLTISGPSRLNVRAVDDVQRELRAVVMSGRTPWIFYDTIAELLSRLPQATRISVAHAVKIETGRQYECLRITSGGRWQVAWEVDSNADIEDREIALDWYMPNDHDGAPIVPIPIIDYVAGCVSLLRGKLVLPAAGVLSIALEAALWDALSTKGISRYSEQITYEAVKWHIKRMADKFVLTIDGDVRNVKELDSVIGIYPSTVTLDLRRLQASERRTKIGLRFDIDASLCDFFASHKVESREQVVDKGLTVAIQKARKEGVECLQMIPETLDATLIPLRNNLIHLSPRGNLHEPVPIPDRGELRTVDELRANDRLVRDLLPWVVELINSIYASQLQSENPGGSNS